MNTQPTPETESWCGWGIGGLQVVPASFARKLERERDELKRWTSVNGVIDLQRERDEARAKIELSRRWSAAIADIADNLRSELATVTEQRDRLAEALRVATAYPLTESWYNQAIEALATLKP
jgi:hypothetical protein